MFQTTYRYFKLNKYQVQTENVKNQVQIHRVKIIVANTQTFLDNAVSVKVGGQKHGGWRSRYHYYRESAAQDGPNGQLSTFFSFFSL